MSEVAADSVICMS